MVYVNNYKITQAKYYFHLKLRCYIKEWILLRKNCHSISFCLLQYELSESHKNTLPPRVCLKVVEYSVLNFINFANQLFYWSYKDAVTDPLTVLPLLGPGRERE